MSAQPQSNRRRSSESGATPKIVLVEDNPSDVLLVREALRGMATPVHLTVADNGQEGLALLLQGTLTPDLIILDLNLPKLDGFGVLAGYQPRAAPVIIFSSSHDRQEVEKAMALGASDFVHKPYDIAEFIDSIQKLVTRFVQP